MTKNKNMPIILTVLICVISIAVMIIVLMFPSQTEPFTPPPFDSNAIQGTPNVPDGLGWGELDAQVFKASICGVVIPDGNAADVWFTNPESNSVWLKLRVLDNTGNRIGETGIIRPGEYVQTVTFASVPKTGDTILLKLMAYEPETYYSAGSVTLTTTIMGGEAP